jgi:hypothetical protein
MTKQGKPDAPVLSGILEAHRVVFHGIDWGRKDWTACICPRCSMPHRWRTRRPKKCRACSLHFTYTSSIAGTDAELVEDAKHGQDQKGQ